MRKQYIRFVFYSFLNKINPHSSLSWNNSLYLPDLLLLQEDTFLRLWDNRSQLNSFGNLQAFIFTIAKHQVIDDFRKQVNELQFEDFMEYCENQESDVSPEDLLLYDEFLQHPYPRFSIRRFTPDA